MNKNLWIILALTALLSFSGCGEKSGEDLSAQITEPSIEQTIAEGAAEPTSDATDPTEGETVRLFYVDDFCSESLDDIRKEVIRIAESGVSRFQYSVKPYDSEIAMDSLAYVFDTLGGYSGDPDGQDYVIWDLKYGAKEAQDKEVLIVQLKRKWSNEPEAVEFVDQKVAQILGSLDLEELSDYKKAYKIYTYICKNIRYAYLPDGEPDSDKHSIYDALTYGKVVCAGYAHMFHRLAVEAGLKSQIAHSKTHAWNVVEINGIYYHVDATWGAPRNAGDPVNYQYFLVGTKSKSMQNDDHVLLTEKLNPSVQISDLKYDPDEKIVDGVLASGQLNEGLCWELRTDNVLRMTGTGAMPDFQENGAPWHGYTHRIFEIELSEGITSLGSFAFEDCVQLKAVNLPRSITTLGKGVFADCIYLEAVNFSEGVTGIPEQAFRNCISLRKLSHDVVEKRRFESFDFTSMFSLEIPSEIRSIGAEAFYGCTQLGMVTFPEGMETLEDRAFGACSNLLGAVFLGDYPRCGEDVFKNVGENLRVYCTGDLSQAGAGDVPVPVPMSEGRVIFENETYVSDARENVSFWWILCPDGTLRIEGTRTPWEISQWCADHMAEIRRVELAEECCTVGAYLFQKCTALTEVVLEGKIDFIGEGAFLGCKSLTRFTVPEGVEVLGSRAFWDCSGLKEIRLTESLTTISYAAFGGCKSLETIRIPANVSSIGERAFWNCSNLKSIEVDEDNPYFTSVDGVLYSKDMSTVIAYPEGRETQEQKTTG